MEEEKQMSCHHHSTFKKIIGSLFALGIIALGIVSVLRDRIVNPPMFQVSFTAEGRVFAKPDIAQIMVAVNTSRVSEAVQAVKDNTEKMNNVIKTLKDLAIEDKDIKTTAYQLTPVYDYRNETGERILAGYDVYQEVTVKIRDLDKVGSIIESTTKAGANQVGNVTFTIDDIDEIQKQAREEAVAKAKKKAEEMVQLTGIKLGKLVNVYESQNYAPTYNDYAYKLDGLGGGVAPEIQTGENETKLEITLVYQVK